MQFESHPNVVGATKARHKSCSKLDATSISRNCIDCFERLMCQCMDLHFMHRFSDHKLRHLIDTVRLLADTPAYCGPRRRKVACACSRPWGDRTQEPDLELASKVPSRRISNRQIYTYPIKFQSTPLCTDQPYCNPTRSHFRVQKTMMFLTSITSALLLAPVAFARPRAMQGTSMTH
jgi:hypothetical protein